jgi:ketosteroid isomerase-like protein
VRAIYKEWERGNLGLHGGRDLYDPEIVYESFDYGDPTRSFAGRGVDDIQRFVRDFLVEWRDYRIFGEEFCAPDEDHVLVRGHHTAVGRQSELRVRDPAFTLWTFRDGRIVAFRVGRDLKPLLEAGGLTE